MPENPYQPPKEDISGHVSGLTIPAALGILVACTVLFAGIGGSLGWLLGTLVPGYYRSVFSRGDAPGFDPIGVGIGQGLTQGVVGGVVVGLVVIAIFAWRESRRLPRSP